MGIYNGRSQIGELEYENFNAASAEIIINGKIVHPGYAKQNGEFYMPKNL